MAPPLLLTTDEQHLALATNAGAEPRLIREAGFGEGYSWPVWSPEGSRALVSHGWRGPDGEPQLDLLLADLATGETGPPLFRNADDHREPIAPDVLHYACWAPDGARALVTARGEGGLTLSLLTLSDPPSARTLVGGAPVFTSWAPDGRTLAVHAGPQLMLFEADSEAEPRRLLRDQPRFRAPAWSPDGSLLYYAAPGSDGRDLLWRSPRDGGDREIVCQVEGLTALLASPVAEQLALLTLHAGGLGGRDLRILDPGSATQRIVERGDVLGALWAPDGSALFYVSRAGMETDFALTRYDVDAHRHQSLARFRPSPAFSTYLAFFDQYAQSHRLISADGRWIALGGSVSANGASARRPFAPQYGCYVLPTDGSGPPQRLAAGEIGFFSPAVALEG